MIQIDKAARYLRGRMGLSQRAAAKRIGISDVHLCNVENGKSSPSPEMIEKLSGLYGIDVYVFAWCVYGKARDVPPGLRQSMHGLSQDCQWYLEELEFEKVET